MQMDGAGLELQDQFTTTKQNELDAPALPYPIGRMTGAKIDVEIHYHNAHDKEWTSYPWNETDDTHVAIAYMKVSGRLEWNSQQNVDPFNSANNNGSSLYRSRYMYNISLTFTSTGSFSFFSPFGLATALAVASVYIFLPAKVVGFVAEHLLGALSDVSRSAHPDIRSEVRSLI